MNELVVFSYRNDLPANNVPGDNLPDWPEIFAKLRKRDMQPVVSLHAEEAFVEDGVEALELVGAHELERPLGVVALDGAGVLVNRLDRSIKLDKLPHPSMLPPVINENATRSLAFRKIRTHEEVLEPLGLSMPTVLPASVDEVQTFLDNYSTNEMVFKPNNGTNRQNINRVSRENLAAFLRDNPELLGQYILQPAFDFTVKFPEYVKPFDRQSHEAFEGWNIPGQTKEVRVYGFHSPERTDVFPVARAIDKTDHWFFIDPDSLPERAIEGTRNAIARAAEISQAKALFGTVDYGYGSSGSEDPEWRAIELNGRMPYMVGYGEHPDVADKLRELLADQIKTTAQSA